MILVSGASSSQWSLKCDEPAAKRPYLLPDVTMISSDEGEDGEEISGPPSAGEVGLEVITSADVSGDEGHGRQAAGGEDASDFDSDIRVTRTGHFIRQEVLYNSQCKLRWRESTGFLLLVVCRSSRIGETSQELVVIARCSK